LVDGASSYELELDVPECVEGAADTLIIATDADWSNIDSGNHRVVCVQPGVYTTPHAIHTSGTASKPRWLRWYDPSAASDTATHPVNMPLAQRAIVKELSFEGASHWIVDRVTFGSVDEDVPGRFRIMKGSNDHVLNRVLVEHADVNPAVLVQGDGVQVQHSVIRKQQLIPAGDVLGIKVMSSAAHVRIVSNEIYDMGDAVHFGENASYLDAVVDNNDLYFTSAVYSDCNGNLDPAGSCACMENAIDFKGGGTGPSDPIRISNNRMWGSRMTDPLCGGTGSDGPLVGYSNTGEVKEYILFEHNVLYDAPYATAAGTIVTRAISYRNNVLYDFSEYAISWQNEGQDGFEAYFNSIVSSPKGVIKYNSLSKNLDFVCNTVVDADEPQGSQMAGFYADYNGLFGVSDFGGEHDVVGSATASENAPFCFVQKRLTAPEVFCIPNAIPTSSSPHAALCSGVEVGSRPDVGIDDLTLDQSAAGPALPSCEME
jgi:hypothetical protein